MTYPINTASDAVLKLREYISDERPMNLKEMSYLLAVLDPLVKASKNLAMNVQPTTIPGWLLNDFLLVKQKL